MNNEQKVVVVTGSSHGIGAAFVDAYRERGWRVVGNARTIAKSTDPDYITVPGDIGDPVIARKVVNTALDQFGRVDTLINNAGIWRPGRIEDISEETYRQVMRTNLDSVFFVSHAVARHMIARKRGKIINVCSVQSELGRPSIASAPATTATICRASNRATACSGERCSSGIGKLPLLVLVWVLRAVSAPDRSGTGGSDATFSGPLRLLRDCRLGRK
jgi:NAD(P)-dependent dehydrogenase (short-subunit alcohol dehydrogenase family)